MAAYPLEQIWRIVEEYPLVKKILITDSFAKGHQWVQQIARNRGPLLHLDIQTLHDAAVAQARESLFYSGRRYVPDEMTYWLVLSLMKQYGKEPGCYVPSSMATPGVVRCFHRAILELRQAGIAGDELADDWFEQPAKAAYLRKLMGAYARVLHEHRLIDAADLGFYAEPYRSAQPVLFLIDGTLEFTVSEQRLLQTIVGVHQMIMLEPEQLFTFRESEEIRGNEELFRALGPLAELREAIRRVGERKAAWDEVEFIFSDYAAYAPILYSLAKQWDIPCTFAQGVPIHCTLLGKGMLIYLDWLGSNFEADRLLAAFRQEIITAEKAAGYSALDLIEVIETCGIGWGRERYELLLSFKTDDEPQRRAAEWLHETIRHWLMPLPECMDEWSLAHVSESMKQFVHSCDSADSEGGASFIRAVEQLTQALNRWGKDTIGAAETIAILKEWLETVSLDAEGIPAEGKLHVTSVDQGGHSGRPHVFLLGMEERIWSLSSKQDPILLDDDRLRIGRGLRTAVSRSQRMRETRQRRIGGIGGKLTGSYSAEHLADQREASPSYELLLLFRRMSGEQEADFERMQRSMKESVGYFNRLTTLNINVDEYLLSKILTSEGLYADGLQAVLSLFPMRTAGLSAMEARRQPQFGKHDGLLRRELHASGFLPAHVSASRLETYARCPLQFYFRDVLRIRPKETVAFDRMQWLDVLQRGTLLHDIFYTYMSEYQRSGRHSRERLTEICEEKLEACLRKVPAPSPHIYAKECDAIRQDADVFWNAETKRHSKPSYFELELHKERGIFELEVSEELRLPMKGFVDRIDETAPHRYKVIDYKTGNPNYYDERAFFAKGTQIQHALYALAVEQWLRQTGIDPLAEVVEAGYFFPTQRGLGEEMMRDQRERKKDAKSLLRSMVDAIQSGLFPPAGDPGYCARCDYAAVCGEHAAWKKEARSFPPNRERLAPLLEVNRHD